MHVSCPTCKKSVEWSSENEYRPFCCKRCQLIDLGEWASEGNVISEPALHPDSVAAMDEFDLDELEQALVKQNASTPYQH